MTEREKRIKKIQALLRMTVENGASEQEMFVALDRARKMMDEYDVSEADLAFGGETVTTEAVVKPDFDRIRDHLAPPVGMFCGCQSWKAGTSDTIVFCGLQSEAIFAHWLLDMLTDFVVRELDNYGQRNLRSRRVTRHERQSFIGGCTSRITQRLRELTPRPAKGTGTDLVVAKNALVEAYMKEHGIKLREPFKLYSFEDKAFDAGTAAGDRAQFSRPVDGMSERRLIR